MSLSAPFSPPPSECCLEVLIRYSVFYGPAPPQWSPPKLCSSCHSRRVTPFISINIMVARTWIIRTQECISAGWSGTRAKGTCLLIGCYTAGQIRVAEAAACLLYDNLTDEHLYAGTVICGGMDLAVVLFAC